MAIDSRAMAMSASLVLPLLLMGSAVATPASSPLNRVLNGPANDVAIFEAHGALKGCLEPTCQAVANLARAFDIATRRDLPNTMTQLGTSRGGVEREAEQSLRRLLPPTGPFHAAYCPVLTKMAHHYSDHAVGLLVVEFANRIDGASDQCTRVVIAALPATTEAADMVGASRDSCQAARRAGCERDRR